MTRAEVYAQGFNEGWRWAEADLAAHDGSHNYWSLRLREDASGQHLAGSERAATWRAENLGRARGYRSAVAAFERGRLAREMFELAPRSPR